MQGPTHMASLAFLVQCARLLQRLAIHRQHGLQHGAIVVDCRDAIQIPFDDLF